MTGVSMGVGHIRQLNYRVLKITGQIMLPFYVYILKCKDKSYYTGHTDDLEKRLSEHKLGLVNCYTFAKRPVELVYFQECATRDEALCAELKIKGWSRKKKEALIKNDWKLISLLSKKIFKK